MIYLFLLIVNATETSLDHFGSWLQRYSWWGTKRICFISGCNVGALRNSLSCQHVRLENRRDQEWLMISLPHRECVSAVWTAHRAHQHLQAFVPRLGAHLWMPACPHHSRGPSQARGHQSSGLALVVWVPAFGDFLDFGVSWAYPSFLHLPAITFFSDLGLGLLMHLIVHHSLHTWERWAVFSAFFLIQDIDYTNQHLSSPPPHPSPHYILTLSTLTHPTVAHGSVWTCRLSHGTQEIGPYTWFDLILDPPLSPDTIMYNRCM